MKQLFTTIYLIISFLFQCASAQSANQEAHYKYGDKALREYLQKKFTEEVKTHNMDVCLISATFAKFSIGPDGNIADIKFSENKDTPPVFRDILTDLIMGTNGRWNPNIVNGKTTDSRPFVLPLIFQMEAGCHNSGEKANNGTDNALIAFLNDDNGIEKNETQLDCILLKSLNLFSQN
jgi:hypothetical protein